MTGRKHEAKQGKANNSDCRIVGIGASAGGLEALEQFLKNVPSASGLAFVIVQHLDPNRKDMMVELLQRVSAMPIAQAADGMRVLPDHVYIIPPNRELSLLQGTLYLEEPLESSGLRLPIDHFFRSLAADQQERGIGVILSGMGSDGTLGLRALKEKSGAVFVQDPASAQFDGMPRSAINAGLADVVAPAEELAVRIVSYLDHVPLLPPPDIANLEKNQSGLEKIILLLRAKTGHDFTQYKKSTLYRRIERRMGLQQLNTIKHYATFLRNNPQEVDLLFKELLIGVTNFFRDAAMWQQLKAEVIPAMIAGNRESSSLRAWVAACSTGEEAYSLAMVFREVLDETTPACHAKLQIFATDLDRDAVDKARTGFFPTNIAVDVSEERLQRFFIREEGGYRVKPEIREMVIFAPQNLIVDPPFTKLDLMSCRNLLIYLEPGLQKKLLSLFHYSLKPRGFLVLGVSETAGQSGEFFEPRPGKMRLYRRLDTIGANLVEFSPALGYPQGLGNGKNPALPQPPSSAPNLSALTDELLLRHFTPPAVLTTRQGDIVYLSARTGKYLEPTVGKANLNIFAMAREGLAGPLNEAFARAVREKATVTLNDLKIQNNGNALRVEVVVQPLSTPAAMQGMMLIVFREIGEVRKARTPRNNNATYDAQLAELTRELQQYREDVQITHEENQASQEELKAANEELQSTNEELQSTNEELTTSKEEMFSMNEELQTINQELTAKMDELSAVRDDMENLLNSTDIATLFLDSQLRVRRFTPKTTKIFKLIPGDTGRPITDQVNELDYPDFAHDVQQVMRSLGSSHRQVSTHDGRWFLVRILPYRTQDNRIDGVVITFVDISESKKMETAMTEALSVLQTRFSDQSAELEAAKDLENVLRKAQAVLEKRFEGQTLELHQAHADLQRKGATR